MSRALRLSAYGAAALLAAFELWVVWLMLHPAVPADYRAYYIDQTTTCLNQPVSGEYAPGTTVSFLPDGRAAAKPIRVCGWEGPAGDGTHAVGTSARLRFAMAPPGRPLALRLGLVAISRAGVGQPQRVAVSVNGEAVGTPRIEAGSPQVVTLPIPEAVRLAAKGRFEVVLEFPDAVRMGPTDPPTRWRSVKLTEAAVIEAPGGATVGALGCGAEPPPRDPRRTSRRC